MDDTPKLEVHIEDTPSEEPLMPEVQELHQAEKKARGRKWLGALNYLMNLVLILLIVFFVRAFIVAPFEVSGASMTNTLEDQEYIIVNKILYSGLFGISFGHPERGDIVVIEPPINKKTYYIKRIIGLPGETVKFQGKDVIIINNEYPEGKLLTEEYLRCEEKVGDAMVNSCNYGNMDRKEFKVPDNSYFVMGDNRNNSTDSRVCFYNCNIPGATPFVNKEHIVGKTWFVVWPLSHARTMPEEAY